MRKESKKQYFEKVKADSPTGSVDQQEPVT